MYCLNKGELVLLHNPTIEVGLAKKLTHLYRGPLRILE